MINIQRKEKCCGCSACVNICPLHCIEMKEDEEGFLYPSVNEVTCVDCKMCEKVCPVLNGKQTPNEVMEEAYAAYAKDDDIREKSSSGGIFSVIANEILKNGGVVFGAAFDKDFSVKHMVIKNIEDLDLLRGSKYLQSRIEDTYQQTKAFLENGRTVLYSGVACQIAGLKNYLGKEYKNLYTVDVLCHGVPSPKLWKKYVNYQEKMHKGKVVQAMFRHKKYGWKLFAVRLGFSNEMVYEKKHVEDIFMKLFLRNICLRPSCHSCEFKQLERPSDITLGDCWGIGKIMPEMDDDKGTSIILVHSKKGQDLLRKIKSDLLFRTGEVEKLLPPTADSRKSVQMHRNRKKLFKKINNDNVEVESLVKLLNPKFSVRVKNKVISILVFIKHKFV